MDKLEKYATDTRTKGNTMLIHDNHYNAAPADIQQALKDYQAISSEITNNPTPERMAELKAAAEEIENKLKDTKWRVAVSMSKFGQTEVLIEKQSLAMKQLQAKYDRLEAKLDKALAVQQLAEATVRASKPIQPRNFDPLVEFPQHNDENMPQLNLDKPQEPDAKA